MCLLLSPTREPNLQSTHNNKKIGEGGDLVRSGIRIRIGSVNSFVNATRQQLSVSLSLSVSCQPRCLFMDLVCFPTLP